jgi:hypothetical protein
MARVSRLRTLAKSSRLLSARHDATDAPQAGVFAPASFRARPCVLSLSTRIFRSVHFHATQSCAGAQAQERKQRAPQRARPLRSPRSREPPDRRRASPLIVRPNLFCRRSKVARPVSTETQLEAGRHSKHPHKCCRRRAASASDVAKCRRPSRTPSAANGVWMSSSSCANPCSRWCRRRADPVSLLSGRAPVAVAPNFRLSLRLRADDHMYRATTSDDTVG